MRILPRRVLAPLFALAVCLSVTASANEQAAPPAEASSAPVVPKAYPALWKVSDADTTIYLFGTVHILPKGLDWYGGPVSRAFEQSDELVTEIVETKPQELAALIDGKARLPKGQTLRGLLSPEARAAYEARLASMRLPGNAFDVYEPWYASILMSSLPLAAKGYDGANGVEVALDARAKALRIPRRALETAEYQIGLFDSLPLDMQRRYLAEVVEHLPQAMADVDAMIAAWERGDAERLAELMNAEEEDDAALMELLLIGRNRTWAKWIAQRMDQPGTVFLAVGAGHLAGTGSVQDQLAKAGIQSQRVQ